MGIVTIIKENAEALVYAEAIEAVDEINPTFFHGEPQWQNIVADNTLFPITFLDEPITSNDDLKKSGYIEETYPVKILIANKSSLDYNPSEHNTIVEDMRDLSKKLITRLSNDARVKSISNITRTNVINLFNANITGVYLKCSLVLNTTNAIC